MKVCSLTVTGQGTLRGPDQSQDTIQLGHTTVTHNGMHKTYHKPKVRAYWDKFLSTTFGRMHCKLPELTKGSFKQWKITGPLLNNKRRHEEVTTLHMQMHGMNGAMGGRLQSNMQSC